MHDLNVLGKIDGMSKIIQKSTMRAELRPRNRIFRATSYVFVMDDQAVLSAPFKVDLESHQSSLSSPREEYIDYSTVQGRRIASHATFLSS